MARIRVTPAQMARLAAATPAAATLPAPLEADVQAACLALLVARGAWVLRVNGGLLPTPDGRRVRLNRASAGTAPDIVCCYRGRFIGVEVKRDEAGGPTAGQAEALAAIERAGGVGVVAGSVRQLAAALDRVGPPVIAGDGE